MPLRATFAATLAAVTTPLAFTVATAGSAEAAPAAYLACDSGHYRAAGNGWSARTPGRWESASVACNLRLNDPAGRPPYTTIDTPGAIRALQWNLNSCYRAGLVVDGSYGPRTRAAVQKVQRQYGLTADGVYGPATRSAMNWRLYNYSKMAWSQKCYSPF